MIDKHICWKDNKKKNGNRFHYIILNDDYLNNSTNDFDDNIL
jgi:hypothetical protein